MSKISARSYLRGSPFASFGLMNVKVPVGGRVLRAERHTSLIAEPFKDGGPRLGTHLKGDLLIVPFRLDEAGFQGRILLPRLRKSGRGISHESQARQNEQPDSNTAENHMSPQV